MKQQSATALGLQTYIPSYFSHSSQTNLQATEIVELVNSEFSIYSERWIFVGLDPKNQKIFDHKFNLFGNNRKTFAETKNFAQLYFVFTIVTNALLENDHDSLQTDIGKQMSEKFKNSKIFKLLKSPKFSKHNKESILKTIGDRLSQAASFYEKQINFNIEVSELPQPTRQPLAQLSPNVSHNLHSALSSVDPNISFYTSNYKSAASSSSSNLQNPASSNILLNASSSADGSSLSSSPTNLRRSNHPTVPKDQLYAPFKQPRLTNKENQNPKGPHL